jgi:hypothetical protein
MEILGLPCGESKLLGAAARIDDLLHARRMAPFANMSIEVTSAYSTVSSVTPNRSNIPNVYYSEKEFPTSGCQEGFLKTLCQT